MPIHLFDETAPVSPEYEEKSSNRTSRTFINSIVQSDTEISILKQPFSGIYYS